MIVWSVGPPADQMGLRRSDSGRRPETGASLQAPAADPGRSPWSGRPGDPRPATQLPKRHPMLTTDQALLLADALELRDREEAEGRGPLWFAPDDWYVPEAHRLWERRYLARKRGPEPGCHVFRATDETRMAFALFQLVTGDMDPENRRN